MILSVDPGLRGSGAAMFNEVTRALVKAAYVRNPEPKGNDLEVQWEMANAILKWANLNFDHYPVLVVEWMQVYPDERQVNPNTSLLPLVGIVSHLSGAKKWGQRVAYRPREWKGSLNGDAMTRRIVKRLSDAEKATAEPCSESLAHNMWDAVGIGLKFLGRLDAKRVIPRE